MPRAPARPDGADHQGRALQPLAAGAAHRRRDGHVGLSTFTRRGGAAAPRFRRRHPVTLLHCLSEENVGQIGPFSLLSECATTALAVTDGTARGKRGKRGRQGTSAKSRDRSQSLVSNACRHAPLDACVLAPSSGGTCTEQPGGCGSTRLLTRVREPSGTDPSEAACQAVASQGTEAPHRLGAFSSHE